MNVISTRCAQDRLSEILGEVALSRVPIVINDEQYPAVLVSADDWHAIQETLYLLSMPGMRESIREGLQTPLEECTENLWSETVSSENAR